MVVILGRAMFRGRRAVKAGNLHDSAGSLHGWPTSYSRSRSPWKHPQRMQTLPRLIHVRNKVKDDPSHEDNGNQDPSPFEDVSTVDERLQVSGAESFAKFERRIDSLDKELRNFANAARQLGSSVGILSAAFRLRERLTKILFLFRENAATLFPRKVQRQEREALVNPDLVDNRRGNQAITARPVIEDNLDPETFPEQFEKFAQDVVTFLNSLKEFPQFTDEAFHTAMRSFEGDLKYWAACLQEYKTQFRHPAVQRYIHGIAADIGDHIDNITVALCRFIETGVPTVQPAQQDAALNPLNLPTVASFFSAVAVTAINSILPFVQEVQPPVLGGGNNALPSTSRSRASSLSPSLLDLPATAPIQPNSTQPLRRDDFWDTSDLDLPARASTQISTMSTAAVPLKPSIPRPSKAKAAPNVSSTSSAAPSADNNVLGRIGARFRRDKHAPDEMQPPPPKIPKYSPVAKVALGQADARLYMDTSKDKKPGDDESGQEEWADVEVNCWDIFCAMITSCFPSRKDSQVHSG
ncbi:hypothetical protein BJ138DRAFT_1210625 [Hygrophoropsis aurantiaca]|uniref:Uncharacterized protein n=1 Tax=Hygrophoropsis aurantiaca TaxID=72124 RepID=A0ACB8A4M7_9AGAM|nr:hypothetical protein BJ138DRAFT_1210625 [Hygrophoropsis aurantiaca]